MKFKKNLFLLLLFLSITTLTGCAKKIDYSQISDYSDSALTSIIMSFSQSNYDLFASVVSDDLKESYDYDTFQQESRILLDNLGTLENIEFEAGEIRNGYISAIYNGTFSDEPDNVRISISYKEDDDEHKIYEFFMSSPKITEAISKN